MDESARFAKAYLEYVDAARRKLRMSHSELARRAFRDEASDPVGRWRKIRNHNQHLRLADAFVLAQVVGQDFASICWKVAQHLEGYTLPVPGERG
jgi:hypothetical protein